MNINATGTLNIEAVKTLCRTAVFRKSNPKIAFPVFLSLCAAVLVWSVYGSIAREDPVCRWSSLCLGLILLYLGYSYFILPYIQYRSLGNLKDAVNAFTFSDDGFMVVGKTPGNCGESEISYTMVEQVIESTKYFFIFHTKNQAFVVEKSTFSGGTPEELRDKLSVLLGKKYYINKY